MRSAFSDTSNTVCMDIDWVVGGCMSIDPENDKDPVRVQWLRRFGAQPSAGHADPEKRRQRRPMRQRGGLPYDERNFTVCVEDVS
jgi:hypothetical protein